MKPIMLQAGEPSLKNEVFLELTSFGRDWLLKVFGGDAHLGAVACSPENSVYETIAWNGHKESVVVQKAFEKINPLLDGNLLVIAGIHYDGIKPGQIESILENLDHLLEQLTTLISN